MEGRTMKKIVLSVILVTCIITGILQRDHRKHEGIEKILAEQTYMVPDVIINPLIDPITN